MKRIAPRVDWLIAMAIALASLLLYLRTLAPDVVDADGAEFQFAAWNFSFVHPTGYPLFLFLGGLFEHLFPLGNPAYRLNVFTAICASFAVGALYLVVTELTRQRGAAILAAFSFALTTTFWIDASGAEAYALNTFFLALLIFLALRWQSRPSPKTFAVFCLFSGLALTHHRSIILWGPAFILFFLMVALQTRVSGFRPALSTFTALGVNHAVSEANLSAEGFQVKFLRFAFYLSLPLLLYLYIPLRAPASPYFALTIAPNREIFLYDNSLSGFLNYVLGRTFQYEIRWDEASLARLVSTPQLILDQFGAVGFVLGMVGFVWMLWRREWVRLALLLSGFAVTVIFAALYHIGDIFHYYIPAYLVWAIWIGYALAWVFDTISSFKPVRSLARSGSERGGEGFQASRYRLLAIGYLLIALALPSFQFITNFPGADRSREVQARAQWTKILAAPIPPNAILISNDRDEMMPLWYIQYVENTRRDLFGLFPRITPAPQHANIGRLTDSVFDANRPIFFIKPMPGIEIKYRVVPFDASLVRVLGRAADTSPQFPSGALLADRVRVLGYDISRDPGALRVTIYWQLRAKLTRDYTTFVHLLDASGNKVAQGSDHRVGGEFYPTSLWDVGETLRDEQAITLPSNLVQGAYRLVVGMYHYPELDMLDDPAEIGAVELK